MEPIIRPWTEPSLGHCSYLNLCYGEVCVFLLHSLDSSGHVADGAWSPLISNCSRRTLHWRVVNHQEINNAGSVISLVISYSSTIIDHNPFKSRYLHFRVVAPALNAPPLPPPPRLPIIPAEVKKSILRGPGGEVEDKLEGQWLDADVRELDCEMLGQ